MVLWSDGQCIHGNVDTPPKGPGACPCAEDGGVNCQQLVKNCWGLPWGDRSLEPEIASPPQQGLSSPAHMLPWFPCPPPLLPSSTAASLLPLCNTKFCLATKSLHWLFPLPDLLNLTSFKQIKLTLLGPLQFLAVLPTKALVTTCKYLFISLSPVHLTHQVDF